MAFKSILTIVIAIGLLLCGCDKNNKVENDLKTNNENTEIPETVILDEEKTIEFLKSEAEKYAKNTIRNIGTTIYIGKSQIAEYPYLIACINETDTRGIVFAMKEEDGVGMIGFQSYYQGGYPISKTIMGGLQ